MSLVRAFVAIQIPPTLKDKLYNETVSLRGALPRSIVRWANVENMHLTLKFLGNTPLDDLAKLRNQLAAEIADAESFTLAFNGIGVFGSFSRPRVVWAGVADSGNLLSLHKSVETAASRITRAAERRRFSPHLTLGRVQRHISQGDKDRIRAAVLSHETLDFGTMQVTAVHIFESILKPTGAVYRSLFQIELK